MKKLNITAILCGLIIFITSCGASDNKTNNGSITATQVAEGEVAIGNQVWTSKNLDVKTYRNGDTIPQVQDIEAWRDLTTGAWCYYENNTANGTKYGKLYNWYAVNDPRGLAPKGYHIPTDKEWTILTKNLGGESKALTKMKSTSGWEKNGNNTSGFAGLPGGSRMVDRDELIGYFGFWWSSSKEKGLSCFIGLPTNRNVTIGAVSPFVGYSVRCLRD